MFPRFKAQVLRTGLQGINQELCSLEEELECHMTTPKDKAKTRYDNVEKINIKIKSKEIKLVDGGFGVNVIIEEATQELGLQW